MLWKHAAVIGVIVAFPVWWFYGVIPLMILLILYAYVADKCFSSFIMAGPLTSRQVPPTKIAYCQQLSALKLSKAYQNGELRCEDVVRTYIAHIKHVNPYINAMVFECFDESIRAAIKADKIWAAWRADRSKPMPSWLLGVPCTIKECMQVVGCPNTSGHPNRRHIISPDDSPVVSNFRNAGAIILGVTNTSELCMWCESSNYVYGISCNPYDTRCLVGGSSGGEGAAAGAIFSTFSIGSDIGGSIRMPACFNGVYGHKVSPHCISNRGQHPTPATSANHYMATGPISRFAEDLLPLCQVAARDGFLEDPTHFPPGPVLKAERCLITGKPLRIYAVEDFGILGVKVSESQKNAVRTAAQCLEKSYGAKVTYINMRDRKRCSSKEMFEVFKPFSNAFSMWAGALTTDKSETKFTVLMSNDGPKFYPFRELCKWIIGRSEHTLPAIALCVFESLESLLPSWLIFGRLPVSANEFKQSLEELLGDDGIIIAPTFPRPAPRHHYPLFSPFEFQYTAAFNVLRMPVTAAPIWTEDFNKRSNALTPDEARERHLPDDHHLPKGVQIVSHERNDELSLGVAVALEKSLGGYKYPGWAVLERPPF